MLMKLVDRYDCSSHQPTAHAGAGHAGVARAGAHVGAGHVGAAHAGVDAAAVVVVAVRRASWEEGVEVFVGFFVSFLTKEVSTAPAFPGSSG